MDGRTNYLQEEYNIESVCGSRKMPQSFLSRLREKNTTLSEKCESNNHCSLLPKTVISNNMSKFLLSRLVASLVIVIAVLQLVHLVLLNQLESRRLDQLEQIQQQWNKEEEELANEGRNKKKVSSVEISMF